MRPTDRSTRRGEKGELRGRSSVVCNTDGPNPEGLRLAFRLSPGEARIATALAEGLVLREIAQRHGVTYETVRTQLRRLMDKTGSRRQADLVRLVRDFR